MQIRFDRGTVLIDPFRTSVDPATLPGVAWDPRTRSWRAPADAYAALLARLADAGLPFKTQLPDHDASTVGWSMPDLRWYQREALAAWGAANRRGVVALPTGAGKTMVAVAAIASCGVSALCLVPTRVLLDQWAKVLLRHVGEVGRLGDGQRSVAPVTVATYASAITWAPKIGDRFGLVIVDEAHHVGAECPGDVLEMLVAPARLGLTATPPVGDAALPLERHVGSVLYTLAIDDLVGDALADFDLVTIPIRLNNDERVRYEAERRLFTTAFASFQRTAQGPRRHPVAGFAGKGPKPGSDWQTFVSAAMRSEDGRRALAAWRTSKEILAYPEDKRRVLRELLARHADRRTLVFTPDNRTAYEIARELLVYPITHEIGRKERASALDRFTAGEINVLVSAQVLDEGLDVPDAELAIVVGGSASPRRHVQRIGRVLRPAPGKRARVYELTVTDSVEVDHVRRRRRGIYGVGPEKSRTASDPLDSRGQRPS
ncbi:MAG: DEAD/DEAH box helicase [Deltaproteobacteria bacterium]|nr:DEAD/DEAH box helicase [Deltaproteobacteria bacterium]